MIRRIASVLGAGGLVLLAFGLPREAPVAADVPGDLPPSVILRATGANPTPPFVGRWELAFPDTPPVQQRLTLQIGSPVGGTATGRFTAVAGDPTALLARMEDVLSDRPVAEELPPLSALDVRLDLLAERASVGQGDVGATVHAGAFVTEPAGDWRVYRVAVGENGPQCFLGISAGEQAAVLLPRAIADGPALVAHFRSLLAARPASS